MALNKPRVVRLIIWGLLIPRRRSWPRPPQIAGVRRRAEVPVDGGARHSEDIGDLLDGHVACVIHLLGEFSLLGGKAGAAAAGPPECPRGGEPVAGVSDDQLTLQLGQYREPAQHCAAFGLPWAKARPAP